ncbi:Rrf2 family transcriptional regulator [Chitinispirillales bacterium ANBcel5]|uniref:RrF2 family transcriptional regulator n=1 Tax=Cellulosispirillum alkaliphilum TaxID=3039283 RepID=UPI002A50DDC9|nr:Rrf2 family transcriptional regulator [Chitinispirillales bacterium ANBcel5]
MHLIRTTTAFTIGMHAMAMVARNHPRKMSIGKIASLCNVSEAHLAKVVQTLARSGIVKGERGPSGGIVLKKPADSISLLDIWVAIEGGASDEGCPFKIASCTHGLCALGCAFKEHNQQMEEVMRNTKLDAFANMSEACLA